MAVSKIQKNSLGGNNINTYIDLTSITEAYTLESDGYLVLGTNSSSAIGARVYSATMNNLYFTMYSANGDTIPCLVKEGMKIAITDKSGSSYFARFYPLI